MVGHFPPKYPWTERLYALYVNHELKGGKKISILRIYNACLKWFGERFEEYYLTI